MRENKDTIKVAFQPQNATVEVKPGTTVLDAAAVAGIFVDIPCGGQGRCGRCRVKVQSGTVTHRETPHLTAEQMQEGWVLSCVAKVVSPLVVDVPPKRAREKVITESAAARTAVAVKSDWPLYPSVQQYYVELAPPSLEDNTSDLERLRRALNREYGIENFDVSLCVFRHLPDILRDANWQITAVVDTADLGLSHLTHLYPGRLKGPLMGVAVDIGTTTVVVYLVDLRNGNLIGQALSFNDQISCGEDVISRIVYSQKGKGLQRLRRLVVQTINRLLKELGEEHHFDPRQIHSMVVAGNTTMTHLFLGLPSKHIREEPYEPAASHFPVYTAHELGIKINPNVNIYCLPAIAAYVGGDITAGVLSSGIYKTDKLTIFMDVGTNGEIVLGNADWLMTCACSAGPAFEGAGVASGMRATTGAVEDVRINSKTLEPTIEVIEDVPPLGICGSGMLSALAELFVTGVVERSGRINVPYVQQVMGERSRVKMGDHGAEYVLVWAKDSGTGQDIVLTEVDINNLIRTKAAIYAGIAVMARGVGVELDQVEEVLIGGAFGQHINLEAAIQIGLLPDLPWDRFKYLGNTSAWGAYEVLLSKHARAKVDEIAGKMTYMELIADNSFMNEFTSAMFLPHTEVDTFPSVKALLNGAGTASSIEVTKS